MLQIKEHPTRMLKAILPKPNEIIVSFTPNAVKNSIDEFSITLKVLRFFTEGLERFSKKIAKAGQIKKKKKDIRYS